LRESTWDYAKVVGGANIWTRPTSLACSGD
jgi:hypothetical protein